MFEEARTGERIEYEYEGEKKREREKRGEQITLDGTRANGQNESQTINSLWQPNIDIEAVIPLSFFSDFLT